MGTLGVAEGWVVLSDGGMAGGFAGTLALFPASPGCVTIAAGRGEILSGLGGALGLASLAGALLSGRGGMLAGAGACGSGAGFVCEGPDATPTTGGTGTVVCTDEVSAILGAASAGAVGFASSEMGSGGLFSTSIVGGGGGISGLDGFEDGGSAGGGGGVTATGWLSVSP